MAFNNVSEFKAGFRDIHAILYAQQLRMMEDIAMNLLHDALEVWDTENRRNNMTGNTRYSFIAGVFYQGSLVKHYTTWDVAENIGELGDAPTAGYSFPGDEIWFYSGNKTFKDVEGRNDEHSDEITHSVVLRYEYPYKFQKATKGGSGITDAADLLQSLASETNKKGFDIIIGVGVPYAEYLMNTRKLHILMDTFQISKQIADSAINNTRKL